MRNAVSRTRRRLLALAALAGLAVGLAPAVRAQDAPIVAAASDLKFALEDVAAAFREQTGLDVTLVFGSSGNFYRQIREGAPFEMYLSADEQYVRDLVDEDLTLDEGALYAIGRIAIVAPHGSALTPDGALSDLRAALAEGRIRRFAIANPAHAPYGRRAEEALRHAGLWDQIEDKLVLGENVSQAAQFATSTAAQGGIIAYSLAIAPEVSSRGSHALIPESWHAPLHQRMALLRKAGDTARRFYAFVQEPAARAIFRRYGFLLPGETS